MKDSNIVVKDGVSYETPSYVPDTDIKIQASIPNSLGELPKMPKLKMKKPYIIDWKTKNISFLQVSMDLAAQGIENNTFFLQLFDETLQGVDPFSPFLTQEQIFRIQRECEINAFYFIRECVRIPDQGGSGIPYQLNRANLATAFLFLLNIDHYLVIPRQTGKTMSTLAILLWAYIFGTSESEFMFINKSMEDANNNLARLKVQRDLLPYYMRSTEAFDDQGKLQKGTDNVKSIKNPVNRNKIVTKPSASSASRADNIGRGTTQPLQYYDEVNDCLVISLIDGELLRAYSTKLPW